MSLCCLQRRAPFKLEVGSSGGFHSSTAEDHYCFKYFKVLGTTVFSIIDQPGYGVYRNLEELLVNAARGKNYEEFCGKVVSFYKDDFNAAELQV